MELRRLKGRNLGILLCPLLLLLVNWDPRFFEYVHDIAAARLRQRISQIGNIPSLATIIYVRGAWRQPYRHPC